MFRDLACIIANGTVAHVVGRDRVAGMAIGQYVRNWTFGQKGLCATDLSQAPPKMCAWIRVFVQRNDSSTTVA